MRELHLIDLIPIGFGVLLFLALLTAPGWGPDALAFLRWCVGVVRARRTARYIQPSVKDYQKGEREKGVGVMTSKAASVLVPPAVPAPGTATCTGDTGFSINGVPSNLTYKERVAFLAKQVDAKGDSLWSGKKIYALVGGNYGEFVALMRVLRPKDTDPAEEPTILTPIAGRPTKASLYADPEFVYQPPPE